APGEPWKAIRRDALSASTVDSSAIWSCSVIGPGTSLVVRARAAARRPLSFMAAPRSRRTPRRQQGAGPGEIGRSINAERNRVNERGVDPHARLEGTQLLQPLAPFQ